jgi:hypothetical protein
MQGAIGNPDEDSQLLIWYGEAVLIFHHQKNSACLVMILKEKHRQVNLTVLLSQTLFAKVMCI